MKNIVSYLAAVLLISSCNMAKQYANQRAGGKMTFSYCSDSVYKQDREQPVRENDFIEIKNDDLSEFKDRETPSSFPATETISSHLPSDDTLPVPDTLFLMDDDLSQAFASPAINTLGALFGFLTLIHIDFVYFAAPFYVLGIPGAAIVGIISFSVDLYKYNHGLIDRRNKKYLWLWVIAFLLSLTLAIFSLLLLL